MSAEPLEVVNEPTFERFAQLLHTIFEDEEWPFHPEDFRAWIDSFEEIWCFLNIHKESDKIIAGVGLGRVKGGDDPLYGIGFYFCRPEYRGKGLADPLFKRAMDIVGDDNAALCGVPKMSPLYASRYGFNKMKDYTLVDFEVPTVNIVYPDVDSKGYTVKDSDVADLIAYDATVHPVERKFFIEKWISGANKLSTKSVYNERNEIVGYAHARVILENKVCVGPFYANDEHSATILFKNLLQSIPNLDSYKEVDMMYPGGNKVARRTLDQFTNKDLGYCEPCRPQFTQRWLEFPEEKVFAVTETGFGFV